jgi:hypothetical protein
VNNRSSNSWRIQAIKIGQMIDQHRTFFLCGVRKHGLRCGSIPVRYSALS